jgi:DNA helicase-2/ATP-dependent DNA helicase PcrA
VTVQQIFDHLAVEKKSFRTPKAKEGLLKKLKQFPARSSYQDQLARFVRVLQTVAEQKQPRAQIAAVERFYRPILQARYDDHTRRQREIEHLLAIAKRYKTPEELLADVALDPSDSASEASARGQGTVTLSTVHSAKGLEWNTLFVIWMMDGWFPSSRSVEALEDLEEERRLLYVAATRAKKHLYFTYPATAHEVGGPGSFTGVSRFLEALPPGILTHATLFGETEE